MTILEYIDPHKLEAHLQEGFVEKRHHPSLPLDLYVHTRKAVLDQVWDETTTKTRGLIIQRNTGEIIARPFEKFFNLDTLWRPETHISGLPLTKPVVADKLDGSLGTLYTWAGQTYVATKGSFVSEQALWATQWYADHVGSSFKHPNGEDKWPRGYTPIVEIIAESVQHHVVHYNGREELVLLALINNETGEELNQQSLRLWGARNGLRVAETFDKHLGDILREDRKNAEGYVVSWPREGQSPLKIKLKFDSFLDLQKIVHAATPSAILDALKSKNVQLLDTWIGQSTQPLGQWVQGWVMKFNQTFGETLVKARNAHLAALAKIGAEFGDEGSPSEARKAYAMNILENAKPVARICFTMLDGKDHIPAVWKFVEEKYEDELGKPFTLLEE